MLTRYYYFNACSFLFFLSSMVVYFFITEPKVTQQSSQLEIQYKDFPVQGPLQPIPTITQYSKEWALLGKALFNSKLLSTDNSISCASCHMISFGGDDGFPVSTGVNNQTGHRNSPTVLNSVFNFRQFWDGRSKDLSEQVAHPIHTSFEMGSNWDEVISKLNTQAQFVQAFRGVGIDSIDKESITRAIGLYEKTLITPDAPIDRYLKGDMSALSEQQKRGLDKFNQYGCVTCHQGRNIGGNFYQKLGRLDLAPQQLLDDLGLYEHTGHESDKHVFKVPSLRNVAETAPYFHNGSIATLEEAVQIMAQTQLGLALEQEDIDDLVALLQSFTGELQQDDSL